MGPEANGSRAWKIPTTEKIFPISSASTFLDIKDLNTVVVVPSRNATIHPTYSIQGYTTKASMHKLNTDVTESGRKY